MDPILIIESPSLEDVTSGDREGEHLHNLLQILRIPSSYYSVHSNQIAGHRLGEHADAHGIVHLAAHGSRSGMHFTDASSTTWQELSSMLSVMCAGKLVVLSSCHSAEMPAPDPADTLSKALARLFGVQASPPRAVLTFMSTVAFYDSVLAWGIFYRHLAAKLSEHTATVARCEARWVFESLKAVKGANLPTVKICASIWYERYGKHVDISPWFAHGERNMKAIAAGEEPAAARDW